MKQILIVLLVAFASTFAFADNIEEVNDTVSEIEKEVYIIEEVVRTRASEVDYEDSEEFKRAVKKCVLKKFSQLLPVHGRNHIKFLVKHCEKQLIRRNEAN